MAEIDFPDSPAVGEVYDQWTWNGSLWHLTPGDIGGAGSGFTFVQDSTPAPDDVGDTWYQPSTGESFVWDGTEWVLFASGAAGSGFTFTQDAVPVAEDTGDTWFRTSDGASFVWVDDGNSTQWVQFAPGGGSGSGGSGFSYVRDTAPVPKKEGDTWFDTSTAASGGTSWVALDEGSGELVWVQFAPGQAMSVFSPAAAQGLFANGTVFPTPATDTRIPFASSIIRPVGSIAVNNAGTMTALVAGLYRATAHFSVNYGGATVAGNWFYGNIVHYNSAGTLVASVEGLWGGGTQYGTVSTERMFDMAAGDYLVTTGSNSMPAQSTLRQGNMTMERVG